jgi:hypothetical protein
VDHETVFQAGSVSKTVFAYAVMKLVERNILDLDTPLTRYSPIRILEGDPRLDLITARHVLSHTSGLPNWRSERNPLSIRFTPGERYLYSGEGYSYLQSVVPHGDGVIIERLKRDIPFRRADIRSGVAVVQFESRGRTWKQGKGVDANAILAVLGTISFVKGDFHRSRL